MYQFPSFLYIVDYHLQKKKIGGRNPGTDKHPTKGGRIIFLTSSYMLQKLI